MGSCYMGGINCQSEQNNPLISQTWLNHSESRFGDIMIMYIHVYSYYTDKIRNLLLQSVLLQVGMIWFALLVFVVSYVQGDLLPLELTTTSGCYYQGSYYPYGSFQPTPCEHCQCTTSGQAMCAVMDCFMTPCADPVHEKDKCCPTCPNGIYS
jgi:hypothetical protein